MIIKYKEFNKLKGWVDNERNILPHLSTKQKIQYFEKRLKRVLLLPLKDIYSDFKKEKKHSSTLLCLGTVICCAIEALGKFYTGRTARGNAGRNFKAFVKEYMNSKFRTEQFNGRLYCDLLWEDFRNGLAHGFAIKSGGFEHQDVYFKTKLFNCGREQLEIDPSLFYTDFHNGVKDYLIKLKLSKSTDIILKNFLITFGHIFINGQ